MTMIKGWELINGNRALTSTEYGMAKYLVGYRCVSKCMWFADKKRRHNGVDTLREFLDSEIKDLADKYKPKITLRPPKFSLGEIGETDILTEGFLFYCCGSKKLADKFANKLNNTEPLSRMAMANKYVDQKAR